MQRKAFSFWTLLCPWTPLGHSPQIPTPPIFAVSSLQTWLGCLDNNQLYILQLLNAIIARLTFSGPPCTSVSWASFQSLSSWILLSSNLLASWPLWPIPCAQTVGIFSSSTLSSLLTCWCLDVWFWTPGKGNQCLEFVATNCKFYIALMHSSAHWKVDFDGYVHVRY